MSKETTLNKVSQDIAGGDLGKARDRLHGLICSYPDDLELRAELAEIYFTLKYPAMAGRYWYLIENKTPEMNIVCAAFERSCGHDPLRILQALKFKGDLDKLESDYGREKLISLREASRKKYGYYPEFGLAGREKIKYVYSARQKIIGKVMPVACVTLLILAAILCLVGLGTIIFLIFNNGR